MSSADVIDIQLEAYNARNIEAFVSTDAEDVNIFRFGSSTPRPNSRCAASSACCRFWTSRSRPSTARSMTTWTGASSTNALCSTV